MDLARNLPLIDRHRCKITVCAFLARGPLARTLAEAGIDVIGPIDSQRRQKRAGSGRYVLVRLRDVARHLLAIASAQRRRQWLAPAFCRLRIAVGACVRHMPARWRRVARRILASVRPWWQRLGLMLARMPSAVRQIVRDAHSRGRAAAAFLPWRRQLAMAHSYLQYAARLSVCMRNLNVDVVHAILPNSYVIGMIASVLAHRPRVVMSRVSLNWYQDQHRVIAAMERLLLHRLVDTVICNSAAVGEEIAKEGVARSKIRVIPNGIDINQYSVNSIDRAHARDQLAIAQDALVFSTVANFHSYKGHADLLRALAIVQDGLSAGWVLLAAGRDVNGNLPRMRELADRLGLADNVRFLGPRDDIPLILAAADVHVSASHTESFPNNILEAMAAGVAVVATSTGGTSELVADHMTGLLVPPRNAEQLACALISPAHDPALRKSMGEAASSHVRSSLSVEKSAKALEDVYVGLAARSAARVTAVAAVSAGAA